MRGWVQVQMRAHMKIEWMRYEGSTSSITQVLFENCNNSPNKRLFRSDCVGHGAERSTHAAGFAVDGEHDGHERNVQAKEEVLRQAHIGALQNPEQNNMKSRGVRCKCRPVQ